MLILSLLFLDLEVLVDQVFLGDGEVCKLELFQVEIMPTQMALLALQDDGVVLVVGKLISEPNRIHSACDNAALVYRVAVLGPREEVCILLSDACIQAVFESAENSCWQRPV